MSNRITSTIRICIDGKWTADDMASFFRACDEIYNFHIYGLALRAYRTRGVADSPLELLVRQRLGSEDFLSAVSDSVRQRIVSRSSFRPESGLLLSVRRVTYGSEGSIDLTGAGEAFKQLKEFLLGIVDRFLDRKKRAQEIEHSKLDAKVKEEQIKALGIENRKKEAELVATQAEVLEGLGFSKKQIRHVLIGMSDRGESIDSLALDGKITRIEEIAEESEEVKTPEDVNNEGEDNEDESSELDQQIRLEENEGEADDKD